MTKKRSRMGKGINSREDAGAGLVAGERGAGLVAGERGAGLAELVADERGVGLVAGERRRRNDGHGRRATCGVGGCY